MPPIASWPWPSTKWDRQLAQWLQDVSAALVDRWLRSRRGHRFIIADFYLLSIDIIWLWLYCIVLLFILLVTYVFFAIKTSIIVYHWSVIGHRLVTSLAWPMTAPRTQPTIAERALTSYNALLPVVYPTHRSTPSSKLTSIQCLNSTGSRRICDPAPQVWDPAPLSADPAPNVSDPPPIMSDPVWSFLSWLLQGAWY